MTREACNDERERMKRETDLFWQEMLDKDDRTSPEEHPNMVLITREELFNFISRAHNSLDV